VALAGCGTEPTGSQEADTPERVSPAPLAGSPIVGCWHDATEATAGAIYDITFGGDGTIVYAGVKTATGKPVGYTGTWSVDGDQLTVTGPNWSLTDTYAVQDALLTIAQGAQTSTYQREPCP
jgi:hypothetical protein